MNKIIRLAVIGVNSFGTTHIKGAKLGDNRKLMAVCDINAELVRQKAEEYNVEAYYTDYKELLKRNDIDAVTIATPDQVHRQIAVDAMRAGKDVLCEKPMALLMEDCREMAKVAKETGRKLMIGQVCRYAPAFQAAKTLIEEGEIGELFFIESEYAHDYSHIPGQGNWRTDPVHLRYPVIGGGCHAVDLIRWIAGNPTEAFAYSNRKCLADWPVDDCTIAVLKFPNGVMGKVLTSVGCKRGYTMRTVIYGTQGTIIVDNTSSVLSIFKNKYEGQDRFRGTPQQLIEMKIPVAVNNHNVAAEIDDFCNAILNDVPVITDGMQGAYTVAVCNAIVQSAETEEKVRVDYNF